MFDAILQGGLLVALVALAVAYARLAARVARLEAGATQIDEAEPESPPARPSLVVRARVSEVERQVEVPAPEPIAAEVAETAPMPAPPVRESLAFAFERLVGGRLLIWVGGIALALAGLFLVRYAVEIGLIGPRARMIAAALFGALLVAAGEAARRRAGDPRIGQALVGAGVLVLYATAYASHALYALIELGTAFAAMAAVAGAALFLSLRHGAPSAALGLAGGLFTPLLVGHPQASAAPLLAYLALLNLALFAVAKRTGRHWLAWVAKVGTLAWTAPLILRGGEGVLAAGLFALVYTVAASLAVDEDGERYPRLAPTLALLQLAAGVSTEDFRAAPWAMFLALAAAGFAFAGRRVAMRAIPPRALALALALIVAQGLPTGADVPGPHAAALAASAVLLLFAVGAWLRIARDGATTRWATIFAVAAAAPPVLLHALDPTLLTPAAWGLVLMTLALIAAGSAYRLRGAARREFDAGSPVLIVGGAGVLLAVAAASAALPPVWKPAAFVTIALATLAAARRVGDGGLALLAPAVALVGAIAAIGQAPALWIALASAIGGAPALVAGILSPSRALVLFAVPALLLALMWRDLPRSEGPSRLIGGLAAAFGLVAAYILFKQVFALREPADFVARGFAERTVLTQALFFAGWLLATRARLAALAGLGTVLTVLAAARFAWFDLFMLNPALVAQHVGAAPIANLLLPAYFGSAAWLFAARKRADARAEPVWLGLFLAALIVGAGLLVRQAFHGPILTGGALPRAEFYGYSLAGLALAVGLLTFGWRRGDTGLRVAGLAILTATMVKVFVVDAAALAGVLRIASFLGLGIALIGMGKLYGTVLGRGAGEGAAQSPPSNRHSRESGNPDG